MEIKIAEDINVDGMALTLNDNEELELKKYTGDKKFVVIPGKIGKYTVTKIREMAFFDCASVIGVYIPDSVNEIGQGAFKLCSNLEEIRLPVNEDYTSIESAMFLGCLKLRNVAIPDSVRIVKEHAFGQCESMVSIDLNNVCTIEGYAFSRCYHLGEVIAKNVTTIGAFTFHNCVEMHSITISHDANIAPEAFLIRSVADPRSYLIKRLKN